jgi:putative tryptophan/tyrosine transport system substrate-binding protein
MRRREFIILFGGTAAWPLVARAQQPAMPVIGYLDPGSPEASANYVTAFRKGLSEAGYVEGRNLAIEYRWADNEPNRVPELAADLVRRRVAAIVIGDSTAVTLAAKSATTTIPIVFIAGGDPMQSGLVASLNRPGGNVTGITHMNAGLGAKRLGLLRELMPQALRFSALVPQEIMSSIVTDLQEAASVVNMPIEILPAGTSGEIDAAFATLMQKRADALLVSPTFVNRRAQIVMLTAYHHVPAIFSWREDVVAGGLMSYGPSITDQFRQAGIYAGRILKGEKPADLPVLQPIKFEFVINLQTARMFGIDIPPTLLARADEVIE